TGTLTDVGDGRNRPLSGFTIFLDVSGKGSYQPGDPTTITNAQGQYSFYGNQGASSGLLYSFQFQEYTLGVILPPSGYSVSNFEDPNQSFFYLGKGVDIDFQVLQAATIAGVVFDDLNNNGVQDPGEPGIPNVTATLSSGTSVQTLNDGSFEFLDVPANTSE